MLTQQKLVNPRRTSLYLKTIQELFQHVLLEEHKGKINKAAEEGERNKPVDKMNFISISWLLEQEIQAFIMKCWVIIPTFP